MLDDLTYKMISIGFPLLTLMLITGSIWANRAWGSHWSWDPKEDWALITWLGKRGDELVAVGLDRNAEL